MLTTQCFIHFTSIGLASEFVSSSNGQQQPSRMCICYVYRILHKDKPPLDIGTMYLNLRESIVRCELFIARVLKFQFAVDHPHKV